MVLSSSSSTISSMNSTTSSNKRISGLVSGMDTDTLVEQLTSGTQSKIDKVSQAKQIASWKQDSYREVISALSEFEDKYLSSASSTSSLLNAEYFNDSTIKNASSAVSISGDADVAANMQISKIASLAKQANFTSSHEVSTEALTTGIVKDSWTPNSIDGTSLTLTYGGKDYSIAVDSDFVYDAGDSTQNIVDNLNNAVSKISDLNGKVSFSYDSTANAVTINSDKTFTIKDGTSNLLAGFGLTKGTTGTLNGGTYQTTGTAVDTDDFFKNTLAAGSELNVSIDGTAYTLKIANNVSLSPTASASDFATALRGALSSAISSAGISDKLSVTVDGSTGAVAFSSTGALSITDGSQNLLQGLGLTKSGATYTTTGTADRSKLVKSYLEDSLSGSTLTFSLNGLSKTITFNESDKDSYSTPDGLASYLQAKLNSAYGTGKVTVANSSGAISFTTVDASSIFSVDSSDASGILGQNGALHTYAGDSNRINTKKMLEDLNGSLATQITPDSSGNYEMSINGKTFTFSKTTTLANVISTINNDDEANVNISYSSVTDHFTVSAKTGGSGGNIAISDVSGNLAASLFGTQGSATDGYTVQSGTDAVVDISFDGGATTTEITRSDNTFSMDGVTVNLLTAYNTDSNSPQSPITFSKQTNTDTLYTNLKSFIDDYNTIVKSLYTKITENKPTDETYAPLTDAQKKEMSETQIDAWNVKAKQGLMHGDMILDSLDTGMRRAMTDMVSSVSTALSQIGISTKEYGEDGQLIIDETTLKNALANNSDKVASMFTGSDGIANRLKTVIDKNIGTYGGNGILINEAGNVDSTTVDSSVLTKQIDDYNTQITDLKDRLKTEQDRYYNEFTQLETYLSKMNAASSWFSSSSSSDSQ